MKIGIMGAMPEEIDGIKNSMGFKLLKSLGNRDYYHKETNAYQFFLVFSRWGKVAASSTATTLINEFNVDMIIFTGVAGAINKHLNVGDIVLSEQFIQHDMNTMPIFERFEIPLTGKTYFAAHEKLKDFFAQKISETINSSAFKALPLKNFHAEKSKLYLGTLATGDQFVSDPVLADDLSNAIHNLMCVDMESGAVAQVCHDYDVPFVAIRVISDKADHSAHIDFPKFAKELASPMNQLIVENILKTIDGNLIN
jgi:adenosylhomocysteine nucleosidase